MPTISTFYGIIVRLNPKEHNPPHFHVIYQENEATFDIKTGDLLNGELPIRQRRLVEAWWEIHKDELLADWSMIQDGEEYFKIDPIR